MMLRARPTATPMLSDAMHYLAKPEVQATICDWYELRSSGDVVVPEEGTPGALALREAVRGLLQVIRHLVQAHEVLAAVGDGTHSEPALDANDALDQAEALCCGGALFADTVFALALLRRKLADVGCSLRDQDAIVAHVDGVVGLLVPGVSVAVLWRELGDSMGALRDELWTALNTLFQIMNAHCPDAASPSASPPSADASSRP